MYFLESRDDGESISFTPQIRSTNVDIKKILDRVFPKNLINPTSVQNAGPLMANMLNCDDFDSREYNGFGELDFYIYRISKPLELKPVITDHVEFMD